MYALPTLSCLPLCIKTCTHVTRFLPGMWLDYCCGLPLLKSATKILCCNNPSLVMFILVVLPLPSHMAFAVCVTSWHVGLCAVLLRGHCDWSRSTVPTSAQMLTQMQAHAPASRMSTLDLIFSLALYFCIVFPPGATQRASEKEVMQGAAWSQLQKLVFLREAVKRLAKQDYNWAPMWCPNNPRLWRWVGNLKGKQFMAEPILCAGVDLLTWVTHTNPHLKPSI